MPADMYSINRTKELIIAFIHARGPSLPVHIARDVKTSPLFAAAFLSELTNEGKLKMSAMKIGSSSLHYLPGQEEQLENFTEHINPREKEAFQLVKQRCVVSDDELEPVHRVAIRAIKDFAHSFALSTHQQKTFWRYYLLSEEEARVLVTQKRLPAASQRDASEVQTAPTKRTPRSRKPLLPSAASSAEITLPLLLSKASPMQPSPPPPSLFAQRVHQHLKTKQLTLLETLLDKKKEYAAKIALDTPLGKQHVYLVAKDKKRVKTEELIEALQKAHANKMPALVLAPGVVEKKAQALLTEWSNLIKFEKLI